MKEDFFYLNQVSLVNGSYVALGKDHIHIISEDLKKVKCLINEGDYPSEESEWQLTLIA